MNYKKEIQDCKKGNTKSFEKIVKNFQAYIYNVSFKMVFDGDLAKDITQQTFIKFWNSINSFDEETNLAPYLKKIAINLCIDHFKKEENKNKYFAELEKNNTNNLYTKIENQDLVDFIKKISLNLSEKQRIVFLLSDIQEYTVAEISEQLNLPAGQVKSNLYYARKNIRESLIKINS